MAGQGARQPGQGIERMAQHIPAVTFSDDLAVNSHGAVDGCQVERLPVCPRRTQDNAAVPGVIRKQGQYIVGDFGVISMTVVN